MKSIILTVVFCCLAGRPSAFAQKQESKTVFTHVNVIPLTHDTVLLDQTVIIENDIITSIGRNLKTPTTSLKIDGTNKFLIPGFADMHAHLPGFQSQSYPEEQYFLLNLLKGVTTVRGMRGHPSQLDMRNRFLKGNFISPTIFVSSPPITRQDKTLTEGTAEATLKNYIEQGYDFIKILSIDSSLYTAIMPIIKRNNWIIAGHSPDGFLAKGVHLNQNSIEHIEPFVNSFLKDSIATIRLFREMQEKQIFNCPDVYWYYVFGFQYSLDSLKNTAGIENIKNEMQRSWGEKWEQKLAAQSNIEKQRESHAARITLYLNLLKRMDAMGVPLLISPGDGEFIIPGYSYHEEIKIFADAGISPYNILRAASYNAAAFFRQTDKWGSIQKGKRADLILLNSNPLKDISAIENIEGVTVKGKWISRKEIEQRLRDLK
jgi:hypothetical protein